MNGTRQKLCAFLIAWLAACESAPAQVDPKVHRVLERLEARATLAPSAVVPEAGALVLVVLGARDRAVVREPAECANLQEDALLALEPQQPTIRYRYRFSPVLALELRSRAQLDTLEEVGLLRSAHLDAEGSGGLDESRDLIRADEVFDAGITGAGTVVAVLDSGVRLDHDDFSGAVVHQYRFLGGGTDVGPGAQDDHGHGTNVTGIIAGQGVVAPRGVAPGVEIVAVKVLKSDNRGAISDWAAGVEHVIALHEADNGIEIDALNMSLVSDAVYGLVCDGVVVSYSAACAAARERGISVFASSGNNRRRDGVTLPSCYSSVVAVGATSDVAPGLLTDFTNRSELVELLAPGASITAPGLRAETSTFSGTSQASPHCAAVACLMREVDPEISPEMILEILVRTGVPIFDSSTKLTFPRIDAARAVGMLLPGEDCNGNGVNDLRDVFFDATSSDCNANDVPDECEISAGTETDCNGNGVPDSCEVSAAVEFTPFFRQGVGGLPIGLVVRDLDGDRAPDIAVADGEEGFVAVLYGEGREGFTLPVIHAAAEEPTAIAAAPFDSDRLPDLVVADRSASGIALLRNEGERRFASPMAMPLAFGPTALFVADLDADELPDVVVVGERPSGAAILYGDGAGGFSVPQPLLVGEGPTDVVAMDVNHDGYMDVLVSTRMPQSVSVFSQEGPRQFSAGVQPPLSGTARALASLDVNGDAFPELAVVYEERSELSLLLNASGGWLWPESFPLPSPALDLVVVDLNGDRKDDVVTVVPGQGVLSMHPGVVGGLREPALMISVGKTPARVAVGDFDLDARLDLVVAHGRSGDVSVQLNRTDGPPPEDRNANGILDECEEQLERGDCDGSGDGMTVTDAVVLINFNFLGRGMPPCLAACDVDVDGAVRGRLTDVIYLLNFLFLGGPPPSPPYPGCAPLEAADREIGCEVLPMSCL